MKQKLIKGFIGLLVFCVAIPLLALSAWGLAGDGGSFQLVEVTAGLITKTNNYIGNNQLFCGIGVHPGEYGQDFALMKTSGDEFVYCIEPGVVSQHGDGYKNKSLTEMFNDIQISDRNGRTTALSKMRWTARLLTLVSDFNRYDRYDGNQTEVRLQHMAIQTLIWEVVCGERDDSFIYHGPSWGSSIQGSMTVHNNRFFELKNQYEAAMLDYNRIPVNTKSSASIAPTINLRYDSSTGYYQTKFKDTNNVAKWFKYEGDSNVEVIPDNDNYITIRTKKAGYTSNVISGYNTLYRANFNNSASSPSTYITGHATEKRAQYTVSAKSIKDPSKNSHFRIYSVPQYYLDLNGLLDGVDNGGIAGWGTADVKINGKLVSDGNDITDFYRTYDEGTTYEITDIKSTNGKWYKGVSSGTLSGTLTSNKTVQLSFGTPYYLDLNGLLDGVASGGITGFGTADVWVNGTKVGDDVSDFYQQFTKGSTYRIDDIRANDGKLYQGVSSGSATGTINANTSVQLKFATLHNIDLNGWLDLEQKWSIAGYGTADVYINGSLVANDVNDYNGTFPKGTTFEFKDIKALSGKKYIGVQSGSIKGTLNSNNSVSLDIRTLYILKYDANSGVGAPGSQTKTFGIDITLSGTKPTKLGWTFNGWNTNRDGSGMGYNPSSVYKVNANATLYAQWINYPPVIDVPELGYDPDNPNDPSYPNVPSDIPPYIEGGKVIVQKGDPVDPLDYVKAKDVEDGVITDKVIVVHDPVPRDTDNNTKTPGEYIVDVKVTDIGGSTTTSTVTIIVNDPPLVSAKERWFFVGEVIDKREILLKTEARDREDGDITGKIVVTSIKTMGGVDRPKDRIDSSSVGKYIVSYRVTDRYKASAECAAIFSVVEHPIEVDNYSLRYISKDFINTLDTDSKWKTNAELFGILSNSLNKEPTDENALYVIEFDEAKTNEMKEFYLTEPHDKDMNTKLLERFSSIFIKRAENGDTRVR